MSTIRFIVTVQRSSQLTGLHAHHRIDLGIEIRVTSQGINCNGILLNPLLPSGQGFLHYKAQKPTELVGNHKFGMDQDVLKLSLEVRRRKCVVGRRRHSRVHHVCGGVNAYLLTLTCQTSP